MSALIKNMDIPSSCMRCRLLVHDEFENYYFCPASNKSFDFDEDIKNYEECKPEWCPLEEGVPVVHGRWILSTDNTYMPQCSNCGRHPFKGYIPSIEEVKRIYKHCPVCGAKMDEEQEGSGNRNGSDNQEK